MCRACATARSQLVLSEFSNTLAVRAACSSNGVLLISVLTLLASFFSSLRAFQDIALSATHN
jgi:hypothetical protein